MTRTAPALYKERNIRISPPWLANMEIMASYNVHEAKSNLSQLLEEDR